MFTNAFLALAALPLAMAYLKDPTKFERHVRMVNRAAIAQVTTPLNCTTLNYTTPANLADGSLNSTQGCGSTYQVQSGDSCHSLLVSSNSSFNLQTFLTVNPSVDADCYNLNVGSSYCVGTSECLARSALNLTAGCTQYARTTLNDTYRTFAIANNVTFGTLRALNPNATDIKAGKYYCISNATSIDLAAAGASPSPTDSSTEPTHSVHLGEQPVAQPVEEAPQTSSTPVQVKVEQKVAQPEPTTTKDTAKPEPTPEKQPEKQQPAQQQQPAQEKPAQEKPAGNQVVMSGDATYFDVGLGSCGWTNSNSELVAAAAAPLYDVLGNDICGKYITLNRGGQSVTVKIVDKCPPCSIGSIDLSPTAFAKIAAMSEGRVQMSWDASSLGASAVALLAQHGL